MAPCSWHAQVWHRQRESLVAPGFVLCAHPGEVFSVQQVLVRGSASSLTIDASVFGRYLSEHDLPLERLRLRAVSRMSKPLLGRLCDVLRMLQPGPSPVELETSMVEFVAALVDELVDPTAFSPQRATSELRVAERIREYLHADPSTTIDLGTLAKQSGMSRFRVLRVFKRMFGLPPHTYQLQLRLGLAQKSLREGLNPAQVAAEYGFVDQSHFTRHFKRLLGVTPAQYARMGNNPRLLESGPALPA